MPLRVMLCTRRQVITMTYRHIVDAKSNIRRHFAMLVEVAASRRRVPPRLLTQLPDRMHAGPVIRRGSQVSAMP